MYLCSVIYVGYLAIWDMRRKVVPRGALITGASMGILLAIYNLMAGERTIYETTFSPLPGALLVLLAYATRHQIGYADGILLLILALLTDQKTVMFVFVVAQLLAAVGGIMLITLKKAGKETTMAYIPYILAAMLLYGMLI